MATEAGHVTFDVSRARKWTSTTDTLLLLQRLGLERGNPHALVGCRQWWDSASWFDGGLNLAKAIQQPETCITAS